MWYRVCSIKDVSDSRFASGHVCYADQLPLSLLVLSPSGGMIAPLLGGTLLMVNSSLPVFASIITFLVATVAVMLLRGHEGVRGAGGLMH